MIHWVALSERYVVAADRDPSELTVYSLTIHHVGHVERLESGTWLGCTLSDDGRLFATEAEARAWVEERLSA